MEESSESQIRNIFCKTLKKNSGVPKANLVPIRPRGFAAERVVPSESSPYDRAIVLYVPINPPSQGTQHC